MSSGSGNSDGPDPQNTSDYVIFGIDFSDFVPSPESVTLRVLRFILEHVLNVGRPIFRFFDQLIRSVGTSAITIVGMFLAFEVVGFGVWATGNALMCGAEAGKDQSNPLMALLQILGLGIPGVILSIIGFVMLLPTIALEAAFDISIVKGTMDSMACR